MSVTTAATELCLADQIAVLAAQVDVGMHRLLTCIRRFDESEAWGQQGARTCADWLAWRIGLAPGAAREKVRVARALGRFPAIDQAMAAGKLSYAKARALTRVATRTNEAKLVEIALVATGAQLERMCRRFRRLIDDGAIPGMEPGVDPAGDARGVRVGNTDAGDSALVAVAAGEAGEILDVGRKTSAVPAAIRRALWSRDRGCRFPMCANRRFIHAHHVRHWAHGGPTNLGNLISLCGFHHRLLHEGGFEMSMARGDLPRFFTPRGLEIRAVPDLPAAPIPSPPPIDDPDVNLCGWDGEPVDYADAVDAMCAASG